ncbi:GHMP kinase [Desulfonema limicola]|uniref:GHMP kinase n=1 Tax=Desulfonema limicola TaxID=45656 RepID=A0A975B5C2_9BACT|nr:galactokinase [Desulfonema limicola]QTA79085.1 GHMP kinase [Desulfonema limicola]
MSEKLKDFLEAEYIEASAPCRIDMGGTLDISTFYYPLRHLTPCTFNIALNMRTKVCLFPYEPDMVKITSKGFESAEYPLSKAPFNHPLGLMFAIAAYYRAGGVHIDIESSSPPRSALGGSSVAGVALIGAFSTVFDKIGVYRSLYRREIAIIAHAIEECVAGVPCGLQDQLAAAYGGVNAWQWHGRVKEGVFEKDEIIKKSLYPDLEKHLIVAYCGIPHESKNINQQWVNQFISGKNREKWESIIKYTHEFINALKKNNYKDAADAMNRETAIRQEMTPEVIDDIGIDLVNSAIENKCGARFTGAGGGGCLWALGDPENIDTLSREWENILSKRQGACLLDFKIDSQGLTLPIL